MLSTLVMSLGNSYVFASFYKTMILVFILGVLHSVVFLPVLLSFVGPRRTSRPRTFVAPSVDNSSSRRYSVRGTNCVAVVPSPAPPIVEEAPGPSVELRTLPGETAGTAGSEASHRTSLFAGERDSLSGYEGRSVVFVDRHANSETGSVHSQCKTRPVERTEKS